MIKPTKTINIELTDSLNISIPWESVTQDFPNEISDVLYSFVIYSIVTLVYIIDNKDAIDQGINIFYETFQNVNFTNFSLSNFLDIINICKPITNNISDNLGFIRTISPLDVDHVRLGPNLGIYFIKFKPLIISTGIIGIMSNLVKFTSYMDSWSDNTPGNQSFSNLNVGSNDGNRPNQNSPFNSIGDFSTRRLSDLVNSIANTIRYANGYAFRIWRRIVDNIIIAVILAEIRLPINTIPDIDVRIEQIYQDIHIMERVLNDLHNRVNQYSLLSNDNILNSLAEHLRTPVFYMGANEYFLVNEYQYASDDEWMVSIREILNNNSIFEQFDLDTMPVEPIFVNDIRNLLRITSMTGTEEVPSDYETIFREPQRNLLEVLPDEENIITRDTEVLNTNWIDFVHTDWTEATLRDALNIPLNQTFRNNINIEYEDVINILNYVKDLI